MLFTNKHSHAMIIVGMEYKLQSNLQHLQGLSLTAQSYPILILSCLTYRSVFINTLQRDRNKQTTYFDY